MNINRCVVYHGRCQVDCERGAYGALRVMVNCNQMGEAAARHVAGMLKPAVTRGNLAMV